MNNFTFFNPTRIHFGKGQIAKIKEEIPANAKVMLTYGGGSIKKNGVYDQVMDALQGYEVVEFNGIEPNPHYETLVKAIALAKKESVTYILAVGGGSVIDGSKFIAAGSVYDGDSWDIIQTSGACVEAAIPLGCVLTLPATGSEMNCGSVVTKASTKDKLSFKSAHVHPVFSILDPQTTYTLPKRQIANGAVDSFVHTVEQYITYPVNAKVPDRLAESLLLTILEDGPVALEDPTNYDARANLMWVSTMALNGTLKTGVPTDWATHMIGHELTGLYNLDHAQTLAIVIPAVWKFKKQQKREKLLQYAERVFALHQGSEEERIDLAIQKTEEFFVLMGNPTRLSAYGLGEKDIPAVQEKLILHGLVKLGEHGDITPKEAGEILKLAL
ncbi:alcohol dehydrogenase, NAD(P)-dependent, iron-containing [Psychromonas ingrahamii 37]|uniref:Alcohol dehydrogenase, NAD(P)-dependent, iron-containing n=1 Tax=Psychromonas ingrahamii (strain DSM 17664 / CCUG 51855 / 37) TaxID=357804 RepID=A1SXL9_PSYIN|nr:iron-containing alcohol dehydrogenase [Psychromonas ingrahamii]ABM04234.1 alcohol dehydrogenase, NAD(P)-dependent, iron-containing [Psychromonas ingrahamii 37]